MDSYQLTAPAKINLLLEIIGSRPDGYHELVMVLQSIDLADQLELKPTGGNRIVLHCDHPHVPKDSTNLAYRAAKLMQENFSRQSGIEITIQKHIPIGAGLAGGSTDAAAVLVGLDLMWQLGLTQVELCSLAAQLGSDVPFCIAGGTALALGRGEMLTPLTETDKLYAVLAKYRSLAVSTPWAYKSYRQQFGDTYAQTLGEQQERRRTGLSVPMLQAISHRDELAIGQALYNDLERVVLAAHPKVERLRQTLAERSSIGGMMSGSGPTVFALAQTRSEANLIAEQVKAEINEPDLDLWVTRLIAQGIHLAPSA